ncbi:MAG: monofunctional biosynthetic peptidoglycan transglycosylase [Rhodocyclales bacterium CG17_big_fil_post_rev_8_21_14_2_50_68_7]|nr:MAG: monofunctional biosynthetic peptidoglycan transglycosylase [Betaproteobacteria bacterium CG2_30_68_42]PIV76082.1 MAG: monofunctional biosynthetic peptidoglycan transglycosylase [Rhodocyclales bacterium CG17_big_fil_post_rev_8_21_14_2_50_68_7]PIX74657.1 MAG: monofunctional biosynthetic peptidoglycan transglycosylase [Rhodocyclales bacterium CG_4_10_14_3_um_filter_68_10]PJA58244.1 MAG: monofunctional biosynthetic peptidoglycan transglycosylase [Rhodocyclales bacterium CG_4_9_14_3_um_filter
MRTLRRVLAALLVALLAYQGWFLGHVLWWRYNDPGTTRFMEIRLDELRAADRRARIAHRWVPYERISIHLKRAVVAAEDDRFVEHEGFDWEAMQKAIEKNRRKGRMVAGGSTISQQLAKNLFLSPAKTPWRKAQEAVITLMLETILTKRRILEIYLNVVEWGDGVFGAEAAARHYYGIPAERLAQDQAARLAVLLPSPRRYARMTGSAFLARHAASIAGRMRNSEVP